MQPKFREPIKPGTTFAWMANAKTFVFGSLVATVVCLGALAVRGLDLGIDFKGGTKLIVGFTENSGATPDKIRETLGNLIKEKTGGDAGQIEVQGFNVGDTDAQGRKVEKFQIYTELTSLMTEAKATEVIAAIKAGVGADRIERPEETDKFMLTLATAAPVNPTKASILEIVKAAGFPQAEVISEEERAFDMEFFKEYNLTVAERTQAGEKIADDDYDNAYAAHEAQKKTALEQRTDRSYTVNLQQLQAEVEEALINAFNKDSVVVDSATAVSASVGAELFSKGMLALLYSIVGIVIYVGLRFDFRFGPGAVISLIHDAILTLGLFSILGLKFTLPIVSAILTIIGYSINDTIVVYDRIRENMEKMKGMGLTELIDLSINETLSRTVLTGGSALIVTTMLMVLGGGFIFDFAFALTFGIIIGTYSSIAVAVPFTLYSENWLAARQAKALSRTATQQTTTA